MSLQLVRAVASTENSDEFHLGRLLLLLLAANKRSAKSIEGITKLAKLDFLLRYPNCLEKALTVEGLNADSARIEPYERTTIESKMIRFKYGPWDSRYRRWIRLLAARGLVTTTVKGRTLHIQLTDKGQNISQDFALDSAYGDLYMRSQLVVKAFGNMSASRIKDFVYETFPELENMKWGEEIVL